MSRNQKTAKKARRPQIQALPNQSNQGIRHPNDGLDINRNDRQKGDLKTVDFDELIEDRKKKQDRQKIDRDYRVLMRHYAKNKKERQRDLPRFFESQREEQEKQRSENFKSLKNRNTQLSFNQRRKLQEQKEAVRQRFRSGSSNRTDQQSKKIIDYYEKNEPEWTRIPSAGDAKADVNNMVEKTIKGLQRNFALQNKKGITMTPNGESAYLTQSIRDLVQIHKSQKILEIGAGDGILSLALIAHITESKIKIKELKMVEISQKLHEEAIKLIEENMPTGKFDYQLKIANQDITKINSQNADLTFSNLPTGYQNRARLSSMMKQAIRHTKVGGIMWMIIEQKAIGMAKSILKDHEFLNEEDEEVFVTNGQKLNGDFDGVYKKIKVLTVRKSKETDPMNGKRGQEMSTKRTQSNNSKEEKDPQARQNQTQSTQIQTQSNMVQGRDRMEGSVEQPSQQSILSWSQLGNTQLNEEIDFLIRLQKQKATMIQLLSYPTVEIESEEESEEDVEMAEDQVEHPIDQQEPMEYQGTKPNYNLDWEMQEREQSLVNELLSDTSIDESNKSYQEQEIEKSFTAEFKVKDKEGGNQPLRVDYRWQGTNQGQLHQVTETMGDFYPNKFGLQNEEYTKRHPQSVNDTQSQAPDEIVKEFKSKCEQQERLEFDCEAQMKHYLSVWNTDDKETKETIISLTEKEYVKFRRKNTQQFANLKKGLKEENEKAKKQFKKMGLKLAVAQDAGLTQPILNINLETLEDENRAIVRGLEIMQEREKIADQLTEKQLKIDFLGKMNEWLQDLTNEGQILQVLKDHKQEIVDQLDETRASLHIDATFEDTVKNIDLEERKKLENRTQLEETKITPNLQTTKSNSRQDHEVMKPKVQLILQAEENKEERQTKLQIAIEDQETEQDEEEKNELEITQETNPTTIFQLKVDDERVKKLREEIKERFKEIGDPQMEQWYGIPKGNIDQEEQIFEKAKEILNKIQRTKKEPDKMSNEDKQLIKRYTMNTDKKEKQIVAIIGEKDLYTTIETFNLKKEIMEKIKEQDEKCHKLNPAIELFFFTTATRHWASSQPEYQNLKEPDLLRKVKGDEPMTLEIAWLAQVTKTAFEMMRKKCNDQEMQKIYSLASTITLATLAERAAISSIKGIEDQNEHLKRKWGEHIADVIQKDEKLRNEPAKVYIEEQKQLEKLGLSKQAKYLIHHNTIWTSLRFNKPRMQRDNSKARNEPKERLKSKLINTRTGQKVNE